LKEQLNRGTVGGEVFPEITGVLFFDIVLHQVGDEVVIACIYIE
jgi:hypothetical protein